MNEQDIDRVIRAKGLKRFTKNTLTDEMCLMKDLNTVVARGYSVDNVEHEQGVRCIGAPIRNHEGQAFAAVSVTWPSQRLQLSRIPKFAKTVIATANKISQRLGYRMD